MKQIIEKVMKNLCHDGTILASKTHPNPPLKKEGTRARHAELVSASHGIPSPVLRTPSPKGRGDKLLCAKHTDKNFSTYRLDVLETDNTPHPSPLPQGARGKWAAFTLAEVLITLGIIGVVAALTLPTLIQNYQKQVWVNQLKKAVSVWENGMKMMLADADTDDLRNTELWQSIHILDAAHGGGSYGCFVGSSNDDYIVADNILKKYFKILKFADAQDEGNCSLGDNIDETKKYRDLNGEIVDGYYSGDERKIYMADGTLYALYLYARTDRWTYPILAIDVNGENKSPNQWGRDTFVFHILPNGNLVPNTTYEDLKKYPSHCGNLETGDISDAGGWGCAARIIADGWKMNY